MRSGPRMDSYSRLVAWLKVLLPLAALALLSTLFLLARNITGTTAIPFAEKDIQDRLRDQQVTAPIYSGTTEAGDVITFTADTVRRGSDPGTTVADLVDATVDYVGGTNIRFEANEGRFNTQDRTTILSGDVLITSSTGYIVVTQELRGSLDRLDIASPEAVTATGPIGRIDAGSLLISSTQNDGPAQMIFTNGVKLIYRPQTNETDP